MRWNKKKDAPRRRQLSEDRIANENRQSKAGRELFRRNRTLVGSSSSSVSSAAELDADLRSPRAHVHHLTAHRRRLSSILLFVFIVSVFLVWLIYEFAATVHVSPTASSVTLKNDRYEKIVNDYFASHPIERLRFLVNHQELNEHIKREAPEVASVRAVGAAGFATGQFDIEMRKPIAGWLISDKQYYVDDTGVAFQINYFEQPPVKIVDQSGIPQTEGATVASSRFLQFVGRSVAAARIYNITVEQAIIPVNTTRQVELRISGHDYPIRLSLDRPVGEQVEDLQRVVTYMDSRQQTPKYIDVRVSGRAYYQ